MPRAHRLCNHPSIHHPSCTELLARLLLPPRPPLQMSWALYTGADTEQSQQALEELMAAVEVFTLHVDHDLEVAQDVGVGGVNMACMMTLF